MKINFCCDSGANIHSTNETGFEEVEDLTGLSAEEWKELTEEEKFHEAKEWAMMNAIEIWYEEGE